jgi:hypothetical protein
MPGLKTRPPSVLFVGRAFRPGMPVITVVGARSITSTEIDHRGRVRVSAEREHAVRRGIARSSILQNAVI